MTEDFKPRVEDPARIIGTVDYLLNYYSQLIASVRFFQNFLSKFSLRTD